VHLEEDAGKMIHAGEATLLDFNRAGTPLLEIVSDPDMEVGEEAEVFLQQLRRLVRWLAVSDGNMEEGSLRCDANVSVNPAGEGLGSKVEVKNLNSFKFVRRAITFEIGRQQEILDRGGTVLQETRLWNENRDCTEAMRVKESAHDYRYFPEPDLRPLRVRSWVDTIVLPELPDTRRERFMAQYGCSLSHARTLTGELKLANFFEKVVKEEPKGLSPLAATWIADTLIGELNYRDMGLDKLEPAAMTGLVLLLKARTITDKSGVEILRVMLDQRLKGERTEAPETFVKRLNLAKTTSDTSAIAAAIEAAVNENPKAIEDFQAGKAGALNFLVGQVMKKTRGKADPGELNRMLSETLKRRGV
jgi:aspartyl-tRNA(Asn)/glutamyl-tRNA(Gln) amidotransferase subunit B